MSLITEPNIADQDGFYAALLKAHEGLSEAESARLNARLVLILANHAGEAAALEEALRLARETG
ncbi:MAG: DUF2783 domain-containing protein [Pseudomonadota bacterium]